MSPRISAELERHILRLVNDDGLGPKDAAEAAGVAIGTVRRVLARQSAMAALPLPGPGDKRFTHREIRDRVALVRDQCLVLLEGSANNLAENLAQGRQCAGDATTLGILADKLRFLDNHYQLLAAMKRAKPRDREGQEQAYAALLWTLSAGGSIEATRLLGSLLGIRPGMEPIMLYFEDEDDLPEGEDEKEGEADRASGPPAPPDPAVP